MEIFCNRKIKFFMFLLVTGIFVTPISCKCDLDEETENGESETKSEIKKLENDSICYNG
jgi:hypothetical protein